MSLLARITNPRSPRSRRRRRRTSKISRNNKRYENMEQREALLEYMRLEDEIKRFHRYIDNLEKMKDDIVRWRPTVQRLADEAEYGPRTDRQAELGGDIGMEHDVGHMEPDESFSLI